MTTREEISVEGLAEPISHYCHAVRYGDLLFVSGCAPFDDDGNVVAPGDVVGQTEFVLEQMGQILAAAGGSFADVLKVTVFLTDVADRQTINPVRQKYFGDARPASTLIGVTELAVPGMLVEIEAVAGLPA
ncbi:RidA family protein [Nocardioides aquiterrae]|uniref:RidA family protein n=1 Tax=Nocardioides aquiterrae TaxID=203799 RepID=A0ABN1UDZ1_9ACTN